VSRGHYQSRRVHDAGEHYGYRIGESTADYAHALRTAAMTRARVVTLSLSMALGEVFREVIQ